jgi:RNA polymerase sigma-B factor
VSEEDARGALAARELCYPASLDELSEAGADEPLSPLSDRLGEFDPLFQDAEMRLAIRSALATLPSRLREILRRRYLEGCSQRRVARALGLSQMQICRLERQALYLLRGKISDLAGGDQ